MPLVASSSRMSSFVSVDLPAPDGPDEEHEVALGDDELDVLERLLAVRVAHRDVVEDDDRLVGPASGAARPVRRSRRDGVGLGATVKGSLGDGGVEAGTGLPVGLPLGVPGGVTTPPTGTVGEATSPRG